MIEIVINKGTAKAIYSDAVLDYLEVLGKPEIKRASYVEPGKDGWTADLSLSGGPVLGPFRTRGEAVKAELEWLNNHL